MGLPNAYVVELKDRNLAVIDTGTPGKEKKILDHISTLGAKLSDVSLIILTHSDGDLRGALQP
jgi:glyoxylase-like metal-dependent hydrolase (beta-lactamase superfamily II)